MEELRAVDVTLGAGTIVTLDQARAAAAAGAEFLVSPHLDVEIADWARESQIPYIPGVFTPTEIATADSLELSRQLIRRRPHSGHGANLTDSR